MRKVISKGIVKGAGFMNLKNRMNYFKVGSEAMEHVMSLEQYVRKIKLDRRLKALIKVYVSKLNGCSYCIAMHTKEAKKLKADENILQNIMDWKELTALEEKEKVAFELAEHITFVSELRVDDSLYDKVRSHYNEKEYFDLVMLINQINSWNRLAISMGNSAND
ncbi:carboxymuconolactone decarboxylase family protein [Ornithinibacillus sp. 4-3]|uniref:Carboxymuconolactone decarboxylase family protein n=1 Tax=Ornithinibacillus sp. 4-3 TaxID=3231488 RepID=A0AB39HNT2_9BACI